MDIQEIKSLTARAAKRWGEKIGLVFDEWNEQLSFQEIEDRSNQIANMLQVLGVGYGDRVAVMLRNQPEFPLVWLALAKLGANIVPINVNYKEYDAQYILHHSEAIVIVTSQEFVSLLHKIKPSLQTLKTILSVDQSDDPNVVDFRTMCETAPTTPTAFTVFPETLVNIQYTSGTTGFPKGCMLSHEYWLTIAKKMVEQHPNLTNSDVLLTAQPFYYMDPQWNLLGAIAVGAKLVVLDRFHPSRFWKKVRQYGVTFFYCLGIMPTLMVKAPRSLLDRENNVRAILCSAIPPHLHRELEERWGAPWYEVFGMTETGGDISVKPHDHDRLLGTGCIGKPDKDRTVRIVDIHNRPVSRGEVGELLLRGLGMMDGYYKDPDATCAAFQGGWFHTGDLVRMDEDGYIYYVGRKKEMIRRSGENISAAEVEEVMKMHPAVQYAACLPVKDEIRGEEIKAYVVVKAGQTVPPHELISYCTEHLAYYKVPRYWEYRSELPRTPSERIAKHVLANEKADLRIGSYDRIDDSWR
ncbi:AMP-binding protein [Brevibacillus brevis]|uniref:ATP-dependent acyl-CoA ligase n=1 Tax=Brevibacillus brevis TaxID=1393 RepID=A0A517I5E7_BREBE|nr:AMP-binding protein [Brevibacillus brevis]QDS34123.1 ATP-dependent acyl-CoA ligase [Brevibacillus brevis]